jgi:hypothetical protein
MSGQARRDDDRAVKLRGDQLSWVRYAVRDVVARRRLACEPIPREFLLLHAQLTSLVGTENETEEIELGLDDLVDATGSAQILGCSPRWVRYIAADLDGQRFGGRWVFHRHTVTGYAKARDSGSA